MRSGLKTGLIAGVLATVVAGAMFVASPSARPAQAGPTAILGINSSLCVSLGSAFGGLSSTDAIANCGSIQNQTAATGSMQTLVRSLRGTDTDGDGLNNPIPDIGTPYEVTPADFAAIDNLDANQVHAQNSLIVLFFVNNDAPVDFVTDLGTFKDFNGVDKGKTYFCVTGSIADGSGDPDCDGNTATVGDRVVAAKIKIDGTTPLGEGHVTAIQNGVGIPFTFTVVGPSETIKLSPFLGKDTIQTGATIPPTAAEQQAGQAPLPTDCTFSASVSGVLGANNDPRKSVVLTKVLDNDGNEVAGSLLAWDHPFKPLLPTDTVVVPPGKPTPQGGVALVQTPTIALGSGLGIGFVQFACGGSTPGDLVLKAGFSTVLDASAKADEFASITLKVVGPPASMTLAADPPELACDGTASSKVTATLMTSAGVPVANGTDVNFSVQVLGTANPLTTNATGGTASTTVTPLRTGSPVGVPVVVSAGDIQGSVLVRCNGAAGAAPAGGEAPPPPPAGGAAPTGAGGRAGTIQGPDTGSGGDAGGQGRLSWMPVLGLAAAAGAMLVARRTLKR